MPPSSFIHRARPLRSPLKRGLVAAGLACALAACGAERTDDRTTLGDPDRAGSVAAPIVGGTVDGETKGAVGLAINVLDLFFTGHCSGSLIAPNLVLTAQHCVSVVTNETPSGGVQCNATDFGAQGGGKVFRATTETVRPEADGPAFYRGADRPVIVPPATTTLCGFDVALIVLEGAGVPASAATPLVPRLDAPPVVGETFSAVGYGLTAPTNGTSGTRMRADGRTVTCVGDGCGAGVFASEWDGNAPTCPGDSGGPALDAEGRVIGVVSRGPSDCSSVVYGDPSAWKDLLIDSALEAAAEGGIEPPFWALTGESTPPPAAGLGESCLGVCDPGLACATVGGARSCVPACSAAAPACSGGSTCDLARGACIPHPPDPHELAGGCSFAPPGEGAHSRAGRGRGFAAAGASWFGFALVFGLAFARRQQRRGRAAREA